MPLKDYLSLFADAGITDQAKQAEYGRYIDAAIAEEPAIKVDEITGIGRAQHSLYIVSKFYITQVDETGVFKRRVRVRSAASLGSVEKVTATNTAPSAESIKFEGRNWTKLGITGTDSKGQVVLQIEWEGRTDSNDERERDHLFKVIKEAIRLVHVGLKPLTPRGEYLVAELKDGYGSAGMSADGAWLFGPHYTRALETYQERLALMEPQWILHVEAKLYD